MNQLKGKRIVILATNGFEQSELTEPQRRLKEEGASVDVVSPQGGKIRGWDKKEWGQEVAVDRKLDEAQVDAYDALVLPAALSIPTSCACSRRP